MNKEDFDEKIMDIAEYVDSLEDMNKRLRQDIAFYRKTFEHTHIKNEGTDICKQCGLDLRDEIHSRWRG